MCFFPTGSILLLHTQSKSANPNSCPAEATQENHHAVSREDRNSGTRNVLDAEELLNRMTQMRPFPPISQISKALGSITRMGNYITALSHFDKLRFLGKGVNLVTVSIAINCYCRLNRVDFGFSLLGCLFKSGCTPDVYTFNTLLNGLIVQHKTAEAGQLFKELARNRDIEPNVVMCGTIINGPCKVGNTVTAIRLLRIMEEGSCEPNTIMYSTVIDSLCKDGMVDDAVSLLLEMKDRGQMDEAMRVFNKMVGMGIQPNIRSHTILINGYCKKMKIDEAMHLFREMPRKGLKPTVETFNTVLQGLFWVGRCAAAHRLFDEMQVEGIIPSTLTFGILLDGLCKNGNIAMALTLFHTMERNGLDIDVVKYTILIDALCKDKKMDHAKDLFNKLSTKGLHPNVWTYKTMIRGFCAQGQLDEAKVLFVEMEQNGCFPDGGTYNVIIRGFLARKKYYEALLWFCETQREEEMDFGIELNGKLKLLKTRPEVEQPLCLECMRVLSDKLDKEDEDVNRDIKAYEACLQRLEGESRNVLGEADFLKQIIICLLTLLDNYTAFLNSERIISQNLGDEWASYFWEILIYQLHDHF
ncbi:hypothetical protein RHMOL_Rhmol04G0311700 [Rhododendron molle]|uniref:Uncharacterized protein n=1 Tax=Rhododendron molle TaxID=49168 RepID=A0ACC0P609_RHOML|nr:hypothetical protein RHMOL_Rhmol04G0311700 [Rhododendron molle]